MWSRLPTPAPCIPPHQPCHFCKLNGVEIRNKRKKSLHDCGRRGRAPSFSLPLLPLTLTHQHTTQHNTHWCEEEKEGREKTHTHTLSPVFFCSASKPDIVGFTQKQKRWRKREESEGKKKEERGGEKEEGRERREGGERERDRERERERGKKKNFNPEDAHVWLSSIIPSREDRWRAFQGASPLCYTAKKRRWKEKKCH